MTNVIIINGMSKSGKDTFVSLVREYCDKNEIANVENISSVQPIKDILALIGWDGDRTDAIRDTIVTMKQIWMKNKKNNPMTFLFDRIYTYHKKHHDEDNIIFCHIREIDEIKKLELMLSGLDCIGIECNTLLITRDFITSGDRDVDSKSCVEQGMEYDIKVPNNADIDMLADNAVKFVELLLGGER